MAHIDDLPRIKRTQELNADRLFEYPNVVGVATGFQETRQGFGREEIRIQVFVQQKLPLSHLPDDAVIPREVPDPEGEGVRTDVIDAGFAQPLQDTTRYRPVPGGCSIGNLTGINAGTLGGWACDETDDTTVFLTNNHVVTATGNRGAIPANSGMVQPGQLDGGTAPADQIGQTKRIVPIATSAAQATAPTTAVDAAIVTITADRDNDVIDIGPAIYETATPTLNMNVQKRGRTTGRTTNGRVVSVNASWLLNYGTTGSPAFARIGTGASVFNIASTDGNPFGDRGDSGSLIFDQAAGELDGTRPVVGLLFAGGRNGGTGAFGMLIGACNIANVFNQLDLTTICDCAVRAVLEALFDRSEEGGRIELTRPRLRRKEKQLRRLRSRIIEDQPFGEAAMQLVTTKTAQLSEVIHRDEIAFGLAVRAFGRLARKATNLDVLEAELDQETIGHARRLARRVAEVEPELENEAEALSEALQGAQGKRVGDVLGVDLGGSSDRPKQNGPK